MRTTMFLGVLVGLLAVAGSCSSPAKPKPSQATYHLKCGAKVPPELARTIESKTYHEGRNEVASSPTSRLYAIIAKGQLDSLVLEVQGEKPTVVARMPDPQPTPPIETPMGCDQKYDVCVAGCNSAPDPQCCKCKCLVDWMLCKHAGPGGGSLGITLY